jgi:hypothetical protein
MPEIVALEVRNLVLRAMAPFGLCRSNDVQCRPVTTS